ncbi:hypothetical protein AALB64_11800 [Lachnospiraceae bacterium 45-P1]
MKKKICPCCDQTLKNGIYCKGCRRVVLNPVVWDVDYYLNERHPDSETNCQYHGDLHTGKLPVPKSTVSKSAIPGSARPKAAVKRAQSSKAKQAPKKGIPARLGPSGTTFLCIVMIGVGISLFNHLAETSWNIGKWLGSMEEAKAEPVSDEVWEEEFPRDDLEESELYAGERSDEEVKEAGVPCNGYGHLSIGESEALPLFEALLSETSFQADCAEYSYNQFIDETTWYDTAYEYDLYRQEDYCGYVNLYFDTVDGRMHGIDLVFWNREDLYEMADLSINLLTELNILNDPPTGRSLFDEVLEKDPEGVERFLLEEALEISCADMDGDYYMMYIGARLPQDNGVRP